MLIMVSTIILEVHKTVILSPKLRAVQYLVSFHILLFHDLQQIHGIVKNFTLAKKSKC